MGTLQKKRNQLPCSGKGYDTTIPINNLPNLIVLEIPTDATHKGFEEKVTVVFSKKSHVFCLFGVFFIGLISFWGLGRCVFQGGRKKTPNISLVPFNGGILTVSFRRVCPAGEKSNMAGKQKKTPCEPVIMGILATPPKATPPRNKAF